MQLPCGRGLGRAIAELLLDQGLHVVAVDIDAIALDWITDSPNRDRAHKFVGDISSVRLN